MNGKKDTAVGVIAVGGVCVTVTRKAVKGLRLRVTREGEARLSAPLRISDDAIRAFLQSHDAWLKETVDRVQARRQQAEKKDIEEALLFGRRLTVQVMSVLSKRQETVREEGDRLTVAVYGGDPGRAKEVLTKYRREQLLAVLKERVSYWEQKTGLVTASYTVRDMKTRWGSCSVKSRTVRFALALSERTVEEIDGVILHELCHLKVPGHGPAFHRLQATYMPDWRERQKRLNNR